jgi:hypothetical protein
MRNSTSYTRNSPEIELLKTNKQTNRNLRNEKLHKSKKLNEKYGQQARAGEIKNSRK